MRAILIPGIRPGMSQPKDMSPADLHVDKLKLKSPSVHQLNLAGKKMARWEASLPYSQPPLKPQQHGEHGRGQEAQEHVEHTG